MRSNPLRSLVLSSIVAGVWLATSGCTSYLKRKELEAVARDWCQVVRASQVLPVYPLTEDVQPGDIFLVTLPIGQEAKLYRGKGFLPFEQHLKRLQQLDFQGFYGKSYGIGENSNTPRHWQFPGRPPSGPGIMGAPHWAITNVPVRHRDATAWTNAPRAAFPTYSFEVKSGSGLKLALPVQGIPIGLNFLQAGSASGSITIADSYTYGLSLAELGEKVRAWSRAPEQQQLLQAWQAAADRPLFVRAVNRVYLTGSVVVSLQNQESRGGAASGGQSQEVELLKGGNKGAVTNYLDVLAQLNQKVADSLPGGSVKFAQASSRSVTMNEVFDRPLVIGYLSFDFPILEGGVLGAPVSTLERLERKQQPEVRLGELSPQQVDYNILVSAIGSKSSATQEKIYHAAALEAGQEFNGLYLNARGLDEPSKAFMKARSQWLRAQGDGADQLTRALRAGWEQNLGNR